MQSVHKPPGPGRPFPRSVRKTVLEVVVDIDPSAALCRRAARSILGCDALTPSEGLLAMSLSLAATLFEQEGAGSAEAAIPLTKATEVLEVLPDVGGGGTMPRPETLIPVTETLVEIAKRCPGSPMGDAAESLNRALERRPQPTKGTTTLRWL